jgi:hypothetical protein
MKTEPITNCDNRGPIWVCSGNQSLGDVQVKVVKDILYAELEKALHHAKGKRKPWQLVNTLTRELTPKTVPERWVPLRDFESELRSGVAPKPLKEKFLNSARDAMELAVDFYEKTSPNQWSPGDLVSWSRVGRSSIATGSSGRTPFATCPACERELGKLVWNKNSLEEQQCKACGWVPRDDFCSLPA